MTSPGDQFKVQPSLARLNRAVALNTAAHTHLWILAVTYGVTDQEAAHASEGVNTLLDVKHLLAVSDLGCYICEQPYEDVVGQPCKGDPSA